MHKNENIKTTVRHLRTGMVLAGSGFVVTHTPYSQVRTPKGRLVVEGYYPGMSAPSRYEWNASTTVTVKA